MKLDKEATAKAPDEWEIWRTTTQWQATHRHAHQGSFGLTGPFRRMPEEAIADAQALNDRLVHVRKAKIQEQLVKCPRHGLSQGIRVSGTSVGQPWSSGWHCLRCWIEVMAGLIEEKYQREGLLERPEPVQQEEEADAD